MQKFLSVSVVMLATAIAPSGTFAATTTCSIPQACALFQNNSTGYGVEGIADKGTGVLGVTTGGTGVRGSGTTGTGVLGAATGGTGVRGTGTTGTGVRGSATTGTGVLGSSSSGSGVAGSSTSVAGVSGSSSSGVFRFAGVTGTSTKQTGNDAAATFGFGTPPAYGMIAYGTTYGAFGRTENAGTSSPGGYAVVGMDQLGSASADFNTALYGYSAHGTGLLAEAGGTPTTGLFGRGIPIGAYVVGDIAGGTFGEAVGLEVESDSYPIEALNTAANDSIEIAETGNFLSGFGDNGNFTLDDTGVLTLSGSLYTGNGGPYVRTRGQSGAATIAYGERSTAPAIEDVGEAQLSGGRSFVKIDTTLADALDRRVAYHVFLTPEGDCNGLFVSQKSSTGFVVRELRGGHSTLAFDYRIVAKPFDDNGARLAPAPARQKPHRLLPASSHQHLAVPLTPEEQARRSGLIR